MFTLFSFYVYFGITAYLLVLSSTQIYAGGHIGLKMIFDFEKVNEKAVQTSSSSK